MAYQIGQPGVSSFLRSLLRDLDVVVKMGDNHFLPVNTELKEMENLLFDFKDILLDGEKRRQLCEEVVEKWMDDLKDLFYDIDDLLDEIRMEKQQLQQGQPSKSKVSHNFNVVYNTSKNIKCRLGQVLDTLCKLTQKAKTLSVKRAAVQHDASWLEFHDKFRPKQGCFPDEQVQGREKDKDSIIKMLLTEDGWVKKRNSMFVCVVGMGGLGKTTLAQLVFKDKRVEDFFEVKGWACVSDVVNVVKLTQDLIESASKSGDRDMPSSLPSLQERLEGIITDKKFLVVLDDVWTTREWKQLKGPLNCGAKGSKILITTRLSKVAEELGNKEPYRLGRLEYAHCLKIFNQNAFGDEDGIDDDPDVMKLGEEIVRKCEGVPLLAKVIGSLLNGKDERKWKAVIDNDLWDSAYKDDDLHPGLRLSYFYLPPFLKRCFEYFAIFPSDFRFDKFKLVRMWMAEGLIEAEEGSDPEEIGDEYYNDLKGRSLIQENDMMHDMVHHLACVVSGSSFFGGLAASSRVRHAFVGQKHELLTDANKLRTFIDHSNSKLPLPLTLSYKWLRVLVVGELYGHPYSGQLNLFGCDLKHLRYLQINGNHLTNSALADSLCTLTNLQVLMLSHFESLPQDIGNLSNLRALRLQFTDITALPDSVCFLSKLRFLGLSGCNKISTLPKDVGNLQSLRILDLYNSSISCLPESLINATNLRQLLGGNHSILPAHIGKLTKLERLYRYKVKKKEGCGIDELKDMNRLKGLLVIKNMENIESAQEASMANLRSKKHIEKLHFVWKEFDAALTGRDGEMEVRVIEALEPNAAIKELVFINYVGHKLPSWMWIAPLHNLTTLHLTNLPATREMTGMDFKSLRDLQLDNCSALREVSMTIAKLEKLIVRECKELKPASLVLFPLVWNTLETLECDYYHLDHFLEQLKSTNASPSAKLKELAVTFGGDDGITSLPVGCSNILTSLEKLTLKDSPLPILKIVSEEDKSCCVSPPELLLSIKSLYIGDCPDLVSVESLELAPRLKQLGICNSPNFRNLVGMRSARYYEVRNFKEYEMFEFSPKEQEE